ncbi:MAG: secretin and TonB N-terminal domain-containing protein [Deltaproteobacteria bacterium]|nr:secretin and TonB N-terminal domain-containing protein [Deltaproteobacteria bacterium]
MRRAIQRAGLVLLMMIMTAILPSVREAPAAAPDAAAVNISAGYLENVTFERLPGKERVTLAVTKLSGVTVENQPGNAVLVRMENLFVPEGLRRPLSDAALSNIIRVTPVQKTADGRSWVIAQIDLKQKVPYSVRQEGMNVLIDFNVTSLPSTAESVPAMATPEVAPGAVRQTSQTPPVESAAKAGNEAEKTAAVEPGKKFGSGSRIFLDVQEADIKAVLRLLAEQGKVSIVSGDEVKGNVTLHMKDVPWEQALRTLLDLKGLDQRREGDIITVITLDRKKKDEADRLAAEAALQKAEDERKVREQKQNVEQGKLRQIVIEAKIVEVTTNFSREMGIRWGAGYQGGVGGVDYGLGFSNSSSGAVTSVGSGIGLTGSNVAVNFPSATALAPALGLVLGTSRMVLDAKLSALETTGDGKIISSPKVTTLENEKATIWQGKKIPVVTPATNTSPATVRYEDADLRLVVTPKITPKVAPREDDRISLEIDATNKDVDDSLSVMGNPAINNSGVTSKVVVKDGDTIVVGGIYKTTETFGKDGVPFFSDIPYLGWLFKYETKVKTTREILMFITPRIIKDTF